MKARDLAALAALGIAGKAAYDKYSEKTAPAKKKMGEGLDMTNQGAYELAARPRFEGAAVEKTSRQESDIPEALSRQERDVPDRIMGRDAAGSRFTDKAAAPVAVASPVRTPVVESRSLDSTGGPSRYNRAADSNAAGSAYNPEAPVAQRIAALNEANGAASESARQTDALANTSRAALLVDRANKLNPTAMRASGASTPSARATDALAVGSRANQAAYLAQQRAEQARLDALRSSGGRRAKGGVVKMASGGKVTSKPSGASRGDGIAQRGRTRGKYL